MEKMSLENWLLSMRNKNRYEIQYCNTALMWDNGFILSVDVIDDFLHFQKVNGETWEYNTIKVIGIDEFNSVNLSDLEANLTLKM